MSVIRRAARAANFTVLDNAVINDVALSFRALGVLTFLLSKPDDWRIDSMSLSRAHTEGRDAIRSVLKELRDHGYIATEKYQDSRGRWCTETVVYDVPRNRDISMSDGFPGVGNPVVGNPGAITSTEDQGLKNKKTMRPPSASRTAGRAAEQDSLPQSEDEESVAHGASPRSSEEVRAREQKPKPAKRVPSASSRPSAAERGDTTHACALRFKDGMRARGAIAPANLKQFSATLRQWHRDGLEIDLLREMVDTFIARPDSYMTGRQDIPWRAFINAREKLAADARKKTAAKDPSAKFGKGKQRFAERTALR